MKNLVNHPYLYGLSEDQKKEVLDISKKWKISIDDHQITHADTLSRGWKPTAHIFTGPPASGKSGTRNMKHRPYMYVIDPDVIKEDFSEYDPKSPSAVHLRSQVIRAEVENDVLNRKIPFIIEMVGADPDQLIKKVNRYRSHGYIVKVHGNTVDPDVAVQRNRERPRSIPEDLVRELNREYMENFPAKQVSPRMRGRFTRTGSLLRDVISSFLLKRVKI